MSSDNPFDAPSGPPPGSFAPPAMPGAGGSSMPELASWGQRAGGFIIDALISVAVQLVVGLVSEDLADAAGLGLAIAFIYMHGSTGQTPGKMAMKIRLLREEDGQTIGFWKAFVRNFAHIVDALPLLLGFFWPIWDDKKQTFADKLMSTVVVRA